MPNRIHRSGDSSRKKINVLTKLNKTTIPLVPSERGQSRGEELLNSISHGIGLLAAIVGTPILMVHAAHHGATGYIVGTSIFAATMILLYLSSTIYHALTQTARLKKPFRVVDHTMIYLLIAGTYTPFTLGVLHGAWGWTLFGIIWGLAAIGVTLKVFNKIGHPVLSTGLYLIMGWLILVAIEPLYASVPAKGLLWLLAGGICYTVGVAFFSTDKHLRYGHAIWHLFVLGGTVCHYFAVWYAI
jgi:hemolysin III